MNKNKVRFHLNNQEICAGGVILYRMINSNIELLLIKSRDKYEDFGGKIDKGDVDIYDTIAREVKEESNNLIDYDSIMLRIKDTNNKPVYVKYSKYLVFILEANDLEKELTSEMFGTHEIHDNINRTVHWISMTDFLNLTERKEVNFRLINKPFFDALGALKKKMCTGKEYIEQPEYLF